LNDSQTWKDKYCSFLALGSVMKEITTSDDILKILEGKVEPLMGFL